MSGKQDLIDAVGATAEMTWIFYTALRNAVRMCQRQSC